MMNIKELHELETYGSGAIEDLCKLARELDYKDPFQQLYLSNGACVGDLLCLLEDNPGLVETIYKWIENNLEDYFHKSEDEDDE